MPNSMMELAVIEAGSIAVLIISNRFYKINTYSTKKLEFDMRMY